jgi:hypothetical protein
MALFQKHKPMCLYCVWGRSLSENEILCRYAGVTAPDYMCRRFEYDPLRRIPPKPVKMMSNYTSDDFKIEE